VLLEVHKQNSFRYATIDTEMIIVIY